MKEYPGYWFNRSAIGQPATVPRRNDADYQLGVIEMQTIDADCNDCAHFARGQLHKSPGLNWFDGHCRKFDQPTKAYPVQFTGHACFTHRRSDRLERLYQEASE